MYVHERGHLNIDFRAQARDATLIKSAIDQSLQIATALLSGNNGVHYAYSKCSKSAGNVSF